jgi:membrane-bound serine protease (ClpP class)
VLVTVTGLLTAAPASAGVHPAARAAAQTTTTVAAAPSGVEAAPVDVIEVTGRIDGIEANFVSRSITSAEQGGSQLLVIQLDTPGSILSGAALDDLARQVQRSGVPVAVWVGPSGAVAYGAPVRLLRAAATSGIANGAHVGRFNGPCPECRPSDPLLTPSRLSAGAVGDRHALDSVTPTLGDFIVSLDGKELGGRQIVTAQVVQRNGQPRREPAVQVRFAKLSLLDRVLHTTTNPSVAYLLLVLGLLLIVFEFFSVGIGLAGLTGAGALAISAYGLGALGATPLGLVLVGLAVFGYAVDVQAGAPRAWTVIATAALAVGSWVLFPAGRRVSWLAAVLVLLGAVLFAVRGMASMVRSRFSTATIGRESMIGEPAEATTDLAPEGMVRLRGALWRARVNRATPIGAGDGVRVVAIDGLVLQVEPDDGRREDESSKGS